MSNECIYCEACQVFKPLEMYKNLLHSPENASDDEIAQLNERRRQEKELILERDMDRPVMEGSQHSSSQYWFMISSDWLYRWKCFVSNKISSSHPNKSPEEAGNNVRISENEKIGVLPPGPISNECLFENNEHKTQRFKRGL